MTDIAMTIGGTPQVIKKGTFDLAQVINRRDTFVCEIVSVDGSYRPPSGDEVQLTEDLAPLFGGQIDAPEERGLVGPLTPISTRITCNDFSDYAKYRLVNDTVPAGTMKSQVEYLRANYLDDFGVTLDGAQDDGPALPELPLVDVTCDAALDLIAANASNQVWAIDASKALRMWAPGAIVAPVNVTELNGVCCGDLTVIQGSRANYANRIILICGKGTHLDDTTQVFTQVAAETSYTTTYATSQDINDTWPALLIVDGAVAGPVRWGVTPGSWYWDYTTHTLVNDTGTPLSPAQTVTVTYAISSRVMVEDTGEQAPPTYVREALVNAPDVTTLAAALLLGAAVLAQRLAIPHTVTYPTRVTGLAPGQTQTITVPKRNVSGTHLITEIHLTDDADGTLRRIVTAVKGLIPQGTFRETFALWAGTIPSSTIGGVPSSTSSGAAAPTVYGLGGTFSERWQAPNTTDWIPMTGSIAEGGVRARIDSTARGSRAATCFCRARVDSGTLTLRVRDVLNNATVGTSIVISSATLTDVAIALTLTVDAGEYEIQGKFSAAHKDGNVVGAYIQ